MERERELRKYIHTILVSAALYLLFVAIYSNTLADYDLWGYLAFGRTFWETGQLPYHDLFSYTPTKPIWIYHEWLTGVLFYPIYRSAGDAGLQFLRYTLVLATLYLVYLTAVRRGGTPIFACIALVPAMLLISFGYVPVRAQVFTYFFFILTAYILESYRMGQRWPILLSLPAILVLWCNLHGGFLAGIGLIGLYAIGEGLAGRTYLPIAAAGILAAIVTIINPYGVQYWSFIFSAVSMPRPDINEWVSAFEAIKRNIYLFPAYLFTAMALLCLVGCLVRRRKDHTDILVIAALVFAGASHVRHTVFVGLIFGAYLPVFLSEHWQSLKEKMPTLHKRTWIPGTVFVCLVLLIHLQVSSLRVPQAVPSFRMDTPSSRYPLGALNWIVQNDRRGNILPYFDWGQFILWHFYPHCRVAMDGRYETVYEDHVYREYFDFLFARPAWQVFLQKYPHEMILLRAGIRITELMKEEKAWRIAYSDKGSVLFVRNHE